MEANIASSSGEKNENDLSENLTIAELGKRLSKASKGSKKKTSKSSKLSQENEEENALSEDEVKYLIVGDICQEIVKTALDLIYENYLEKQTVYFAVHCSRLAWKALVDWNFQQKDKVGYREVGKDRLDIEPAPSPTDSWAGHGMPIYSEPPKCTRYTVESNSEEVSPINSSSHGGIGSRKNTLSHVSLGLRTSRQQQSHGKSRFVERLIKESKPKKSDDLGVRAEGKGIRVDEGRKDTYELPSPVPLQTKHFPSTRVEVQYAIMPGNPSKGTTLASKNELKTKTIVLKKPPEDDSKNRPKMSVS